MEKILFKENPTKDILELCLKPTSAKTNIKDLCREQFKDNKYILNKYFRNEYGEDCFYANLLYFRDIKDIKLEDIKKELKKDFKEPISLAGYKYNPEHYKFVTQALQDEYEEDLFKCKSREEEELEKYEEYKYKQIEGIDFEAVDKLTKVLFNALRKRWIMIFHLENVPGLINNALECHYLGVSCKPSNNAMNAKIAEIRALLDNKDVIEWLKTNPTDLMFDRCDYVSTYQRVLRQLTRIDNDYDVENQIKVLEQEAEYWLNKVTSAPSYEMDVYTKYLEYIEDLKSQLFRNYAYDIIHNEEDIFEDEILSNEIISTEQYIENTENDDEYLD